MESKDQIIIVEVVEGWKSDWRNRLTIENPDVEPIHWNVYTKQPPMEGVKCPQCTEGKSLIKRGWKRVKKFETDLCQKVHFCREHGFTRIYFTTELDAKQAQYSLNLENET